MLALALSVFWLASLASAAGVPCVNADLAQAEKDSLAAILNGPLNAPGVVGYTCGDSSTVCERGPVTTACHVTSIAGDVQVKSNFAGALSFPQLSQIGG